MEVNIVVPVYNVAPYLRQFMDSLVNQTYQNFDIIAVDDKSTDDSLYILEGYKGVFHERLKIIANGKNMGLCKTRNVGLDNLPNEGSYILFLDSDDLIEEKCLGKIVSAAKKEDADIVMYGLDRFEDGQQQHTHGEMISNTKEVIDCKGKELAYINTFLVNKLFRRKMVEDLRLFDMERWEDTAYLFRVLPRAKKIKFVNEVLYHYRLRNDSLTGALTEKKYQISLAKFQSVIIDFQKDTEEYKIVKDAFETQVFMRCAVGGVCRMSLKNMRAAPQHVRQMKGYLDSTIPGWRCNPYLTLQGFTHRRLKENAIMAAALLYKANLFLLFVWAYWLMTTVLKKDVRY